MTQPQVIEIDGKPAFAVVPWAEWRARLTDGDAGLSDEAIVDRALARIAAGSEAWPAAVVDRLLAGETPIKVFREHRGLTQAQLAAGAGIGAPYLGQIEQGVRKGSLDIIQQIARALKVDVAHLSPPEPWAETTNAADDATLPDTLRPLPKEVWASLKCYVYVLVDPRDGKPFYVGKGIKDRWRGHISEALRGQVTPKAARIREIFDADAEPQVIIHRHGMDDSTAFEVEAALTDAYGLATLLAEVDGHDADRGRATLQSIRHRFAAPPLEIPEGCRVVFLKIGQLWQDDLTDAQIFARVRGYWVGHPPRNRRLELACAVAGGLVRAVYRIDPDGYAYWPKGSVIRPEAERGGEPEILLKRDSWSFAGTRSHEHDGWVGTSVRHLRWGAGNPVRYET